MAKKKDEKIINLKLDPKTKSKLDTLAYITDKSLQELCTVAISDYIDANAEAIAEVEKTKAKFKK